MQFLSATRFHCLVLRKLSKLFRQLSGFLVSILHRLPTNGYGGRRHRKNCVSRWLQWPLRVYSHAFWINQCGRIFLQINGNVYRRSTIHHLIVLPGRYLYFCGNGDQMLDRIEFVFSRLKEFNLKIKPKKSHFFQTSVTFLGHILSADGVSPNPEKVAKIKDWPTPKTPKEVHSSVGLLRITVDSSLTSLNGLDHSMP